MGDSVLNFIAFLLRCAKSMPLQGNQSFIDFPLILTVRLRAPRFLSSQCISARVHHEVSFVEMWLMLQISFKINCFVETWSIIFRSSTECTGYSIVFTCLATRCIDDQHQLNRAGRAGSLNRAEVFVCRLPLCLTFEDWKTTCANAFFCFLTCTLHTWYDRHTGD